MKSLRILGLGLLAATIIGSGAARAQIVAPTQVQTVNPTDLFQDIPRGVSASTNVYASGPQIAGAPGYVNLGAATTGNSYTFAKAQVDMFMQPAGTLAAVTLVTEPNPSDGQRECFLSTQTTTALTITANSGQTMGTGAAPTAGVANVPLCITYQLSSASWLRSP